MDASLLLIVYTIFCIIQDRTFVSLGTINNALDAPAQTRTGISNLAGKSPILLDDGVSVEILTNTIVACKRDSEKILSLIS